MSGFRVKFVNRLLSSDGHPFKTLQRLVRVRRARTAEDAVRIAQHRFEQLEHIPDWKLHAQSVEVERDDDQPAAEKVPQALKSPTGESAGR